MLEGGMENYSIAMFTKSGWHPIEVHALMEKVRRELLNPGIHAFIRAYVLSRYPLPILLIFQRARQANAVA